jgi:hypothetical protein
VEPLIPKINYRLFFAWLFATFFFVIIGGGAWELAFLPTFVGAAFLAFRLIFPLLAADLKGNRYETIIVQSFSSPDNIVTAKIEYTRSKSKNLSPKVKTFYKCLVKRNYQEGGFIQENEFEALDLAEEWLEKAYQDELIKHEIYLSSHGD